MNKFVDLSIQSTALIPIRESRLRSGDRIEVLRREFASGLLPGRERFLEEIRTYLATLKRVETADFEIYECRQVGDSPLTLEATIRYDFVGAQGDQVREERIGSWHTQWSRNELGAWRVLKWSAAEETVSRAAGPIFVDITSQGSRAKRLLQAANASGMLTIGGRFSTAQSESTFTETTAWRSGTSTTTAGMTCTSANPQDFPTGSIAIVVMGHSRM